MKLFKNLFMNQLIGWDRTVISFTTQLIKYLRIGICNFVKRIVKTPQDKGTMDQSIPNNYINLNE